MNYPDFAATVTAFSCPLLPMQDKTEGEFFLQHLRTPSTESDSPPSLALLPFLTSDSDLGAWPECWVSVKFLHAPIGRKGSGSTTTSSNLGNTLGFTKRIE